MTDYVFLGNKASNVDVSPTFDTYSKVIIHISDESAIEVGTDTGRTLEFTNPFGTQKMAEDLLNKLNGYNYQPYKIDGALLNPASEIGDTISASSAYGVIFTRSKQFGRLMKTDVSAPHDEEINHEYQFESAQKREFKRVTDDIRASIILTNEEIRSEVIRATAAEESLSSEIKQTAEMISAEVVMRTGGNTSSFGWSLLATEFGLYANNQKVFYVNSGGAHVKGEITATSGKIGNFNISNAIWSNISNFANSGNLATGVYIGTDGIRLGRNFTVNSSGNVAASSMTLTGTLTVGGANITAQALRQGAERANSGYSTWNGAATSVSNMTTVGSGVGALVATKIYNRGAYISVGGTDFSYNTAYVMSGYGTPITIRYLSA